MILHTKKVVQLSIAVFLFQLVLQWECKNYFVPCSLALIHAKLILFSIFNYYQIHRNKRKICQQHSWHTFWHVIRIVICYNNNLQQPHRYMIKSWGNRSCYHQETRQYKHTMQIITDFLLFLESSMPHQLLIPNATFFSYREKSCKNIWQSHNCQ